MHYIQIAIPWSERSEGGERSESAGHVSAHVKIYTYTHLHYTQIDTPGSERSEASERSESVGHVPVHTKFMYLNSNNIHFLRYA